jgi:hypothetical protein
MLIYTILGNYCFFRHRGEERGRLATFVRKLPGKTQVTIFEKSSSLKAGFC